MRNRYPPHDSYSDPIRLSNENWYRMDNPQFILIVNLIRRKWNYKFTLERQNHRNLKNYYFNVLLIQTKISM